MGNVKQKPSRQIQAYSCIFRHIQAYSNISRHNQAHSGIFCTLCNPGIFRTLSYSEFWHIQNQRHIQNPTVSKSLAHSELETYSECWAAMGYSEPKAYSEACQTSTMEHFEKQLTPIIIFASYNYFRNISFPCLLVHEINMIFFDAGLIFIPEVFI